MKKTLLISALLTTFTLANPNDAIPMSFSLIGGGTELQDSNSDTETVLGAEFAFKCLLSPMVRSQLQFTSVDTDNTKMLQLSANPHYIFNLGEEVEIGAGPHLGAASIEIGDSKETIYSYGLGLSAKGNVTDDFFLGLEARYEWTTDATFEGVDQNFDNAKFFAKVGYNF